VELTMPDFSLLQQPDFAKAALSGYQAGAALGRQNRTDAALQLYSRDPAAGIAAVNAVDPVLGSQLTRAAREQEEYDLRHTFRQNLVNAADPETGKIDPNKARQAYVQAGDVEGAMSFDKGLRETATAQLQAGMKQIEVEAQLLGSATDPTSYAAARQRAGSLGVDLSGVPEQYDPAWVQQATQHALTAKERLDAELKRRDDDRADKALEETKNHNRVSEATAAANAATARGRLGVAQGALSVAKGRQAKTGGNDDLGYLMGDN
jgi:hypothetical protein